MAQTAMRRSSRQAVGGSTCSAKNRRRPSVNAHRDRFDGHPQIAIRRLLSRSFDCVWYKIPKAKSIRATTSKTTEKSQYSLAMCLIKR